MDSVHPKARTKSQSGPELDNPEDLIVLGRVAGAFGIKGWLRITPFTRSAEDLLNYSSFWFETSNGHWQSYNVRNARVQNRSLLIEIEHLTDRTAAEGFARYQIAVSEDWLPPLEPDEYYWRDLFGMNVYTTTGVSLGQVAQIVETGANDVLVVRGERDRWIPFLLDHFISAIDMTNKRITVDWDPDF